MTNKRQIHKTGALGMLLAGGDIPTLKTHQPKPQVQTNTPDIYTEIDPFSATNWHLHDRPETELGDISSFAKELKEVGQQQPCIVRKTAGKYQYEIIAGERRWRAAKHAEIKLKVIIRDLNDHDAAIVQAAENAQRKDLSDYAKGMSFSSLLRKGILTREEIENRLGISSTQVSRLLSFADLPNEINEAISDFSFVSARTAAEIRVIANKSPRHIDALIHLSSKISSGKLAARKLLAQVESFLSEDKQNTPVSRNVLGAHGKPLFIWKQNKDKGISISFSQETLNAFEGKHEELEKGIIDYINKYIS